MENVIYLTVKHTVILQILHLLLSKVASKLSLSNGKGLLSLSLLLLGVQPGFVVTLHHIWRVYIASQVYPLTPSYGSNWGHEIADFMFLPYIYFKTTLLTNYSIK